MTLSIKNSLLALLLALTDLQTPLSENEKSALAEIGEQLSADVDAWKPLIEPSLLGMIQANATLNQLYQIALSQLEAVDGNIPDNLLPSELELEQALPASNQVVTRGFAPVSDTEDFESNEITNVAISILSTKNPTESVKKLSRFQQIKQFLQQNTI
ncbi:hypothetical protein [Scytonema sp. NUACC26]|uniref:hypothetical protein n=1 Tax=Scytonema sp. NUACC26 TaxID=3140176 RepID=UPI0034DC9365